MRLNRYTGYPFGTPLATLAHCLSLKYSTIFYWPTGYPHDIIMSSICKSAIPMTLYYLLQAHRLSYDTLPSSTGPQAFPVILFYVLLSHRLSLWYSIIFYWPTAYPYGTPLSSSGPLVIPVVFFYIPLALKLSL